jgi:choline transport protein
MATGQSLLGPDEGSGLLATSASETVEKLHQNLNILSSLAFTVMLQGTWEVLLVSSFQGLLDGGLAGLFWSYVLTNIGMAFEVLSLAEMASMITASGGQHRWVHEFAPPELQRLHSHLTGWMITMSFQAGAASGPFLVGTLMASTLHPSEDGIKWQGTLFVCIVAIAVSIGNRFGGRALPIFHKIMLVVHCSAFLIVGT